MIDDLNSILGSAYVLTGDDMDPWRQDWTGQYRSEPLAVLRPGCTEEVAAIVKWANRTGTAVVPVSGNTGLVGGSQADGALLLSLDRMNTIRAIRPEPRIAVVEAGVILAKLQDAVADHGLIFPLSFGAQGSAMIGGCLATNAGGSNVLRYGNTRDLVLGLEAVLPNGAVVDLMTELHKNNTGFDLRHLLIGSEGTLGIITAAVLKLQPKPRAYATAMVALPAMTDALSLLNQLQEATGGAVEAFEFMPRKHIEVHRQIHPEAREPFETPHEINILVEIGATAARDCDPGPDGQVPLTTHLEDVLTRMFEAEQLTDAVVAQTEAQRREMWARREAAAEIATSRHPFLVTDIAVPLHLVDQFLTRMQERLARVDPGAEPIIVAHLGDGNVHYCVWPSDDDPALREAIVEGVEDVVLDLGGSFSAEHGIGLAKRGSMRRRKDPASLQAMRAIKTALDPNGILNPGKLLP